MINRVMPLALALAAFTLAGCTSDSDTYAAPLAEVKKKLINKSSSYQSGNQKRSMKVTGVSGNSVAVRLYNDVSWSMMCSIDLEAVDEANTRIVPNCGKTGSASGNTTLGFVETEIAEHTKQILTGEPVDVAYIKSKMVASTAANIPAMQAEALRADADMRNMQKSWDAELANAKAAQDGWGTPGGTSEDGGWGN